MKKFLSVILAFAMMLSLAACGGDSGEKGSVQDDVPDQKQSVEPVVLKASMSGNETTPTYVAMSEFKRLVEEKTDGRYKIEIYLNDQLSSGDQAKGCEMVMDGTIDVDIHSSLIWASFIPAIQVIAFPFLFSGYEAVDKLVLNPECEGFKLVQDWMAGTDLHTVGLLENGFRQISNSKTEILQPSDLKGLKMRIPSISMYVDLYKLLGASAAPMSFSEVYTALSQHTIDGQENPLSAMVTGKFEEVQDYVTMWNYSYDIMILNISKKIWSSLSDEDKAIFDECGRKACAAEIKASRAADADFRKIVEDAGVKVTDLTDEQMNAFVEACAPLYSDYRDVIGEEIFNAFGHQF